MAIKCTFKEYRYFDRITYYVCEVLNQDISNCELSFYGNHLNRKSNQNVQEIRFSDCSIQQIPKGLVKCFPNIEDLTIWRSKIKYINKDELSEYKNLKRIYIENSQIEFLPGDLFEDFNSLEDISFKGSYLKFVEPNILDGLNNLKYVSFDNETNYTKTYSVYPKCQSNATLEEVQLELNNVFEVYIDTMRRQLKIKNLKLQKDISYYLKNHIKDDRFKDFMINIGDREFHVHKFVLAARSSTLADIFINNPEVENLNLQDIPIDIFEIIINYMYTDELPKIEELNALQLFAASGRLNIEELKDFAAKQILDNLDDNNAIKVLKLSNRYAHDQLREKSFDEIKKKYPKIRFMDKCIAEPETVELIIEKFMEKEEAKERLDQEFEKEFSGSLM